jgi:hypothetical protein
MANTAVFGIYPDRLSTENAVAALWEGDFAALISPSCSGTRGQTRTENTRAPEGAPAPVPER